MNKDIWNTSEMLVLNQDATIFVSGQFINWDGEAEVNEYIATWDGVNWGRLNERYHIYDPCPYCGQNVTRGTVACLSCGAPTAEWWRRLDQMLDEWKHKARGLR